MVADILVAAFERVGARPLGPGEAWNGRLTKTWHTPGLRGRWTTGQVTCDPFTRQRRGRAQP